MYRIVQILPDTIHPVLNDAAACVGYAKLLQRAEVCIAAPSLETDHPAAAKDAKFLLELRAVTLVRRGPGQSCRVAVRTRQGARRRIQVLVYYPGHSSAP